MNVTTKLIFLVMLFVAASCTPELNKYCPDPEISYKAEKFKYGSRLAQKQSGLKTELLDGNQQRIKTNEVAEVYPVFASTNQTINVSEVNEAKYFEDASSELMTVSTPILLKKPINHKSKVKVKQRQDAIKLIKRVRSKQQDPDELHYKTRRMAIASTALGIAVPVVGAAIPVFALLASVFGFTLGLTALRNYKDLEDKTGRGFATFGMILSGVWLLLILMAVILLFLFISSW